MGKNCNEIEFRCEGIKKAFHSCNALLFKYSPKIKGTIEVKCNKCGTYNTLIDGKRQHNSRKILEDFSKNGRVKK